MLPPETDAAVPFAQPQRLPTGAHSDFVGALVPVRTDLPPMVAAPWLNGHAAPPTTPQNEVTSAAILASLRRRWLLSLFVGLLLGTGLAATSWFLVPVQAEVMAILFVAREDQAVVFGDSRPVSKEAFESYKATQGQMVKGRFVLNNAINRLDKDTNRPLYEMPLLAAQPDPVAWIQEELQVDFPGEAELMRIALRGRGEDAAQMVKVVNAVKDSYLSEVTDTERRRARNLLNGTREKYQELDKQVKRLRTDFKAMAGVVQAPDPETLTLKTRLLTAEMAQLHSQLNDAEAKVNESRLALMAIDAQIEAVSGFQVRQEQVDEELRRDPDFAAMWQQKLDVETRLRAALVSVKDRRSPAIKRLEAELRQIDEVMEQRRLELEPSIRDRLSGGGEMLQMEKKILEHRLAQGEAWLEAIRAKVDQGNEQVARLHTSSVDLDTQRSEIQTLESIRDDVRHKLSQLEIEADKPPRITQIEEASEPEGNPRLVKFLATGFAAFFGVFLSMAGFTFWDFQTARVNSAADLSGRVGLKVVGSLPPLSKRRLGWRRGGTDQGEVYASLADAVDGIRTTLMREARNGSTRVVLVTSADGHEGKTTLATQLAASLARAGRRTLLVDGDLRHPSAHLLLGLPLDPGFCEILRGESDVEDTIRPTRASGLWMIPAGQCDDDAIQALARDGIGDVFGEVRNSFDYIIFDSAPVLTTPDTLVLGQYVDAAVLSVLRDTSRVPRVSEAYQQLRALGVNVLGSVIGGISQAPRRRRAALPAHSRNGN